MCGAVCAYHGKWVCPLRLVDAVCGFGEGLGYAGLVRSGGCAALEQVPIGSRALDPLI